MLREAVRTASFSGFRENNTTVLWFVTEVVLSGKGKRKKHECIEKETDVDFCCAGMHIVYTS